MNRSEVGVPPQEMNSFSLIKEPVNGFSHAVQSLRNIHNNLYDGQYYNLEGTNYRPGIEVPEEGEFWVLPKDILENVHFHVGVHYTHRMLDTFSFSRSHHVDINGVFGGKLIEVGTQGVLSELVSAHFSKLYKEGHLSITKETDLNVGNNGFEFIYERSTSLISAFANGEFIAQFPRIPQASQIELQIPVSKLQK